MANSAKSISTLNWSYSMLNGTKRLSMMPLQMLQHRDSALFKTMMYIHIAHDPTLDNEAANELCSTEITYKDNTGTMTSSQLMPLMVPHSHRHITHQNKQLNQPFNPHAHGPVNQIYDSHFYSQLRLKCQQIRQLSLVGNFSKINEVSHWK